MALDSLFSLRILRERCAGLSRPVLRVKVRSRRWWVPLWRWS